MTERDSPRRGALPAADRPETAEPIPDAPDAAGAEADAGAGTEDDGGTVSGKASDAARPVEVGGQKGPEPTRYGDWEGRGRCTDF